MGHVLCSMPSLHLKVLSLASAGYRGGIPGSKRSRGVLTCVPEAAQPAGVKLCLGLGRAPQAPRLPALPLSIACSSRAREVAFHAPAAFFPLKGSTPSKAFFAHMPHVQVCRPSGLCPMSVSEIFNQVSRNHSGVIIPVLQMRN